MSAQSRIFVMKAWVQRRRDSGHEPSADDIWARIHHNWPKAPSAEKEAIFQGAN